MLNFEGFSRANEQLLINEDVEMTPLRVGTIAFDWYPFHVRVRRLAEAAADAGHSVDVICLRQHHEKGYEVYNGVSIYRVPMNRSFDASLPRTILDWCWFLLLAGIVVIWLHLKRPYDVIHIHNLPDFLVFAALVPKLLGAKIILDVQDVSPELMAAKAKRKYSRTMLKYLTGWQERISTHFADYIVTVGRPFEELLLRRGVPQHKLTSILNSADPKIFPPSRRSLPPSAGSAHNELQPFILMYHGSVAERNGLDTAIRALALARYAVPHARLDIMGFGENLPAIKKLAAQLEVSNRVVFIDPCPTEALADFVLHGDVGIIPYKCDGFMELVLPTKAYEFSWMHRPIIASDIKGMRSMFRPESVIFCDPASPESFAEAIIDLYQHPEKREQLVSNAAEDYIPYRWELMAELYQQLLVSLSHRQMRQQYPATHV